MSLWVNLLKRGSSLSVFCLSLVMRGNFCLVPPLPRLLLQLCCSISRQLAATATSTPPTATSTPRLQQTPVRPLDPQHRRTSQACLDRRPSPVSSPADHHHNTHASPTTRTHRHPGLDSRGIHHTECSASAPDLRSSAPPLLRHSTPPRGKHACASTHTSVSNAPCLSVRSSKRVCVDVAGD